MFLSEMGYSELVQRLFEKMTFFLVDLLPKGIRIMLQSAIIIALANMRNLLITVSFSPTSSFTYLADVM